MNFLKNLMSSDFLKRNGLLLVLIFVLPFVIKIESPEVRAFLLAALVEIMAILLSGFSVYVFTRVKFEETPNASNLGLIFLGVHICIGLVVLAVYLAQFWN